MILKNVENKENKTATFQVESDAAEFESAVNGAYLKNKASINIPGFRKGKAPRAVVEGMYGAEVFYQDAMDELAPKAFEFGLDESKLRMVGTPSIVDVNVTDDRTASYTFEVTLYPEVTLCQYKGLEAEHKDESVSDEDVDNELNSVRKRNARMIDIDDRAAELGDTVDIDFDGYLDGERFDGGKAEGYSLELGSNSFVPGFEDQVVGMKIGEEKDIDITFPENYTPELAGKAVVFKIKLNGITTPELPELDDEFAKDVSEFDTLDEYKTSLRGDLEKRKKDEAENDFRANILKQAVNNLQAEIPECMILEKVEQTIRDNGAVPATIAVIGGRLKAGLSHEEIEYLGKTGRGVAKASRRDLPALVARGADGATTVTTTMIIAHMAGINVFATGGIGGVHRGAEVTMDISADLEELAQTPVMVVCAGAKSILDLGLTLEYLETKGVPVIGYSTDELPAFYTRKSGFGVDYRVDSPEELAAMFRAQRELNYKGGMLVTNPIPEQYAMDKEVIDKAIEQALAEAKEQHVHGKETTPFLLARVVELTGGDSLESNIKLVLNNATVAAKTAAELAK